MVYGPRGLLPYRQTTRSAIAFMSDYEFTMSLSIRHPNVDPSEISRALGFEPQHSWKVGEQRRGPTGDLLEGVYRETFWMGRLMTEPELASDRVSVEVVVLRTLTQLRKSFDFFTDLSRSGGVAELHVSIFGREDFRLEFVPESLSLLGRLGLTVSLNVTPHPYDRDHITTVS
jgi:hypothetical protein